MAHGAVAAFIEGNMHDGSGLFDGGEHLDNEDFEWFVDELLAIVDYHQARAPLPQS